LKCTSAKVYDTFLFKIWAVVLTAIEESCLRHSEIKKGGKRKNEKRHCERLWDMAGAAYVELLSSGAVLPQSVHDSVITMVKDELSVKNRKPSVSPWDAVVSSTFPPEMVLSIARAYARTHKLGTRGSLREIQEDELFKVVYVSADIGAHPTAHLMTGEIIEMAKLHGAEVSVICVARPERLEDLRCAVSDRCYRTALRKQLGSKFLECGHLSDKEITRQLQEIGPHVVVHAGFHQDGDRPGILRDLKGCVIVQSVAHASTSGATRIDFILCNKNVLPEADRQHFTEDPLYFISAEQLFGVLFRRFR
jgi:hypothetical protein